MLPSTDALRCFESVATTLNFRAAAHQLALSPAALSARIQALEEELEVPLFQRSTRRVALTLEGLRLLPHARALLERLQATRAVTHGAEGNPPLHLRLGTRFELGLSWLLPALPKLEQEAPHRTLHLSFAEGPELPQMVRQGRVDAAITSTRVSEPDLEDAILHPEGFQVVSSPAALACHAFRTARDAKHHVLLDLRPDLPLARRFLDAAGGSAPWPFAGLECLGTLAAVRARLLQGRGVAVLPTYYVQPDLSRGRLVRLFPKLHLPEDLFRLVWAKNHPQRAALHQLGTRLRAFPLR